jgi:hypothetical protein
MQFFVLAVVAAFVCFGNWTNKSAEFFRSCHTAKYGERYGYQIPHQSSIRPWSAGKSHEPPTCPYTPDATTHPKILVPKTILLGIRRSGRLLAVVPLKSVCTLSIRRSVARDGTSVGMNLNQLNGSRELEREP